MKILGFYHVAAINNYLDIVREQIKKICDSGLIKVTYKLFICVVGDKESLNDIQKIIDDMGDYRFKTLRFYFGENIKQYEFPTLELMKHFSKTEDFFCYYIHTKGVSITENNCNFYGSGNIDIIKKSVDSWRRYMEYNLIANYQKCIDELNENDAIGVSITNNPVTHYPGNFWWSKSEYIKKLDSIKNNGDRYQAEFWIGSKNGKLLSLDNKIVSYITQIEGY